MVLHFHHKMSLVFQVEWTPVSFNSKRWRTYCKLRVSWTHPLGVLAPQTFPLQSNHATYGVDVITSDPLSASLRTVNRLREEKDHMNVWKTHRKDKGKYIRHWQKLKKHYCYMYEHHSLHIMALFTPWLHQWL